MNDSMLMALKSRKSKMAPEMAEGDGEESKVKVFLAGLGPEEIQELKSLLNESYDDMEEAEEEMTEEMMSEDEKVPGTSPKTTDEKAAIAKRAKEALGRKPFGGEDDEMDEGNMDMEVAESMIDPRFMGDDEMQPRGLRDRVQMNIAKRLKKRG